MDSTQRATSPETNQDLVSDDSSSSVSSVDSVDLQNNNHQSPITNSALTTNIQTTIEVTGPTTPTSQIQRQNKNFQTPNSVLTAASNISTPNILSPGGQTPLQTPKEVLTNDSETNKMDTTEYILLLFFQEFKEQASKIIDEFAYENKVNDNVTLIVDSRVFSHAAPRTTTNWNSSSHSTNGYNELIQSAMDMQYSDITSFEGSARGSLMLRDVPVTPGSRASEIYVGSPLSNSLVSMDSWHAFQSVGSETTIKKSSEPKSSMYSSQSFEQLLSAFSAISKHHLNSMIEALIDWRVHLDTTPTKIVKDRVKEKLVNLSKKATITKQETLFSNFRERKELAADYIFSLTVLLTLGTFRQPELSVKNCEQVEFLCMDRFRKAHVYITTGLESLQESKKRVLDLFAEIIGLMSVKWFQKISDNFLEQASARLDYKYEAASFIRALKYLKIRLTKPGEVNESVELLKKITDFFSKAKKSEIKRACAESLANMLSPLAEFEYKNGIDYRDWLSGLKNLLSIAKKMCKKASYQMTAFPFRAAVLCLNPKVVFITPFKEFLTDVFRLFKDKNTKLMALDCLLHVLGYYLKISNEPDQIVGEILTKTMNLLLSGKKIPPSIPALDSIYDATTDIIVMVANNRMDYAMKYIVIKNLELDNSVSFLPETVYLALRAFLAIADVNDMKKVSSMLGTEEKTAEFPWVHKLLERSQNRSGGDSEGDDFDKDSTQSIRMSSPFSSYRTLSASFVSKTSSFYATNFFTKTDKIIDALGLYQYQEQISERLSIILRQCTQVYGNFLQSNHTKPLHENLSKDKYASLRVVVTAISCIPRILPSDYTKKELCDMLCRFIVHQYGDIRDISWDTMLQLMDFHTDLRPVLVHSFAEMIMAIDDFRSDLLKSVLKKFLFLLEKWISNLNNPNTVHANFKLPTIYGKLKNDLTADNTYFDPAPIEAVGVVLLCNLNPIIRVSSLKIFTLVREISLRLLEKENKHQTATATVADLIEESGMRNIQNIWKNEESIPETFEKFISDPNISYFDYLTDLLRLIGKDLSVYCEPTSHIALNQITKRILRLNNLLDNVYTRMTVTSEIQRIVELWSHFVNLACSMARKTLFHKEEEEPLTKTTVIRTTPRITSAKDLYEMIYPHLKSNYEKQSTAAVNALGGVPDELLEILLDSIKVLENEAYTLDKQRKNRKRKDLLRVQISRVYSRLSSNIHDATLKEKEFVKEKFLSFVEEQINYSKQPGNMYSIDLQSLRHHLFIVIDNISRKLYYFPPMPGYRTFDKNLRKELLLFAIQWTGYGKSSAKREEEELNSLAATMEKLKDPEEKRNMGNIFRRKTSRMKNRSCGAVAGLMLGEFFETNIEILKNWSSSTRMENKRNPKHIDDTIEDDDTNEDDLSTVVIRESRSSSLRASLPTLSILDTVLRNNTPTSTTPENIELESLGITVLKWIDEILCSKSLLYRKIGIEAIENMLLSNPNLLDICIDQCYNCSKKISKGYFIAICNVFEKCEMVCSIPVILTLIIFKSVSERLSNRNISFRLLSFISQRFFSADSESGNYPYYISNGLEDQYYNNQVFLAAKLARDHPQYAYGVLEEVYQRLAFLLPSDQRALLNSLTEWIPYLNLDEMQILNTFRGAGSANKEETPRNMPESRRILDIMFDITKTYAQNFPLECKEMWIRLATDTTNIRKAMIYLTERGTQFSLDSGSYKNLFAIAQKIAYYCAYAGPQQVVDSLVVEYIQKSRDDIPLSKHYRELSPNIESIAVLTQRQNNSANPPPLVRSDVVLILLSEVAYDHAPVFRKHLPLLLQYMFIRMDHKIKLVSYNSKLLLVHLVHSLVVRQLPHNGGTLEQNEHLFETKNLIHFLLDCKTNEYLWTRDNITIDDSNLDQIATNSITSFFSNLHDENENSSDDTPNTNPVSDNVKQLTSLVEKVVFILKNEPNINDEWGYQSLLWATRSSSIHNVVRSYQIYRTLRPELRKSDFVNILQDLKKYLEELYASDNIYVPNEKPSPAGDTTKIAIVVEIIETLRVIVKHMERTRLVLFPQIFWLSAALLNSDVTHIYVYALRLFTEVLRRVDISDDAIRNVIIASRPENLTTDVQDLLMKGLWNTYSEPLTIELLATFFNIDCDVMSDNPYPKFIMRNIIGLLPRLCCHVEDEKRFRCWAIASDISEVCENVQLKRLAKVFSRYSKGYYTAHDKFLLDLRRPFSEAFFPKYEKEVFDFFIEVLQFGPQFYQQSILSILHSLLLHANISKTNIGKKDGFVTTTIEMLKGPLWYEATRVLDVTVKNSFEKATKEPIQLMHYQKTVTDSLNPRTYYPTSKYHFGYQAGNGIKQCITMIQSIYQYSVQPVHEEGINLLELLENIHASPENEPATIKTIASLPELAISSVQDIDHLEFDMSADEETITEDSAEASTEYDDQATDSDLLSTTSKYRMDLETNSEEEEIKKLDELLLQTLQMVMSEVAPLSSPYVTASIPYDMNTPSSPVMNVKNQKKRTTSFNSSSLSNRKYQQ